MTTRLTLLCHADTLAAREPRFPADETPDAEGLAAAHRVLAGPAVRSSLARAGRRLVAPERRTRETAALLGGGFVADAALRDADVGRWRGRTLAAVAAEEFEALAAWMGSPDTPAPDGDSIADLVQRVRAWMAVQAARGGRVLAVTHPALVRAAVAAALGAGASAFWQVDAVPLTVAGFSHDGRRWALTGLTSPPRG